MKWYLVEVTPPPKNEWVLCWATGWERPAVLKFNQGLWDDGQGADPPDYKPTHWADFFLPD